MLNNATRQKKTLWSDEALPQYLDDFRQLYVNGELPAHPSATLHLIHGYTNLRQYHVSLDIGVWAMQQGWNYIDLRTYGAILSILAIVDNNTQRCDSLYRDVLEHFPFDFCSYDISHGAILPDRSKHVEVTGSMSLLENKLMSKLRHGDWRDALLTLDDMFRVFPFNITSRALMLFIAERPLYESYQVFMMFARSGAFINPRSLMQLIDALKTVQRIGGPLELNVDIARAMFRLLEAYIKSEGELDLRHLNSLLKGVLSLLYRSPIAASPDSDIFLELEHKIIDRLLNKLYGFFARRRTPKNIVTYTILINMSGRLRRKEMLHSAWQGITNAGLLADSPVLESLLRAAGELQIPALVRAAWAELVQKASDGSYNLGLHTWRILATAARNTGLESYVADQVYMFGNRLSGHELGEIQKALKERAVWETSYKSIPDSTPPAIRMRRVEYIRKFSNETIALLDNLGKQKFDSPFELRKTSIWAWPNPSNEQWQRELYDELTLDSPENAASANAPSGILSSRKDRILSHRTTRSRTGFLLSELRYLQFSSINNILLASDVWETKKQNSEREAMIRGNLIDQRRYDYKISIYRPNHREQVIAHLLDREEEISKLETKEQWQARVRNLRNPTNYCPAPSSRQQKTTKRETI